MSLIIIVPAGTEHILISVQQTRASFKSVLPYKNFLLVQTDYALISRSFCQMQMDASHAMCTRISIHVSGVNRIEYLHPRFWTPYICIEVIFALERVWVDGHN